MPSISEIEAALADPAGRRDVLVASLAAEGAGEGAVDERLKQLEQALQLKARCTAMGDGDNVKPLSELTASRADMWCYLQVAHHLCRARERRGGGILIAGLVAMAGGGKSTLVTLLKMLLEDVLCTGACAEVSLDDFLSSQAERPVQGVKTRWDVHSTNEDLGVRCLEQLRQLKPGASVELPLFRKATDDRLPETRAVKGPLSFVLFEGWRVGVHHPNFFAMNAFCDTLVFLQCDFEAILNFKLECIKRDIKASGHDMYQQYGGVDVVFERHYFAVARRYIVPVMDHADVVLKKGSDHHLQGVGWHVGRWAEEKARQTVRDLDEVRAADLKPAMKEATPGWGNTHVVELVDGSWLRTPKLHIYV